MSISSVCSRLGNNRIFAALLISFLLFPNPSFASGNSKSERGKGSSANAAPSPTPTSSWMLPSQKEKSPIIAQAGRSLPIKFQLVVSGNRLTSTDMVQISLVKLQSCSSTTPLGAPIVIVSAKPVPTVVSTASPTPSIISSLSPSPVASPSSKEVSELNNENGTFQYVWRVPKLQTAGCYQLQAQKGSSILLSPVIRVQGTKN